MANGKKRQALTTMTRQHRQIRVAKPVRRLRTGDEAERDQRPIDHAIERIEHPLPGDRGERDRHRPGQDDQRPHELAPRERAQQHQRAELAEDEAEDLRAEREDEGIAQRLPKNRVLHDLHKIRQTDETIAWIVDRVGADRVIDRQQKRHADQHQHIEDCGRDENRPEHVAGGRG